MARKGGWRRAGSKQRFRYLDGRGQQIGDPAKIERIESLVIPPAWKDVWISPRAGAKLQATGVDKAGRRQYLYHPDFRAQQEQSKFDKLVRFAEALPELRQAMGEHMTHDPYDRERVCAVAVRLINMAWFRVGSDRYAKSSRTHGVTTLTRRHVSVRGTRVTFRFRAKHKLQVRTSIVDTELAVAIKELLAQDGSARLFRYGRNGESCNLTGAVLNDYIREHMGEEFTAKDFRTWGGTLTAAIALAEHGLPETETEAKARGRERDADGRRTARKHADGCTDVIRQSRGRRAVSRRANDRGFSAPSFARRQGTRYRSRPGGERAAQPAAFVANQTRAQSGVIVVAVCGTV